MPPQGTDHLSMTELLPSVSARPTRSKPPPSLPGPHRMVPGGYIQAGRQGRPAPTRIAKPARQAGRQAQGNALGCRRPALPPSNPSRPFFLLGRTTAGSLSRLGRVRRAHRVPRATPPGERLPAVLLHRDDVDEAAFIRGGLADGMLKSVPRSSRNRTGVHRLGLFFILRSRSSTLTRDRVATNPGRTCRGYHGSPPPSHCWGTRCRGPVHRLLWVENRDGEPKPRT